MNKILVSPSILNADFNNLQQECRSLQQAGADWIHCDVMDGVFVPPMSFGAGTVAQIHQCVTIPLDVHLMVDKPHLVVKDFANAGANIITFHLESDTDVAATARLIKNCGCKVGISIKPETPVAALEQYKGLFDMILIMSVNPGWGGQQFMPQSLEKIRQAKKLFPHALIQVDGGINDQTAPQVVAAGANVLVAGSYIIKAQNRNDAIQKIKNL